MDPTELMRQLTGIISQRQAFADALGQGSAQDIARRAMQQAQQATDRFRADLERIQAEQEARKRAAEELSRQTRPTPEPPPDPAPVAPPPAAEPFADGPLRFVQSNQAAEICRHYPHSPAAAACLHPAPASRQFLDALISRELHEDAVQFLAFGLMKQLAVLHGALCLREVIPIAQLPQPQFDALRAAMFCVMKPDDQRRLAAEAAAQRAGLNTPAGCLAQAVRAAGQSLSGPGLPEVPSPPLLTAQLVWSALRMIAARVPPARRSDLLRQFLVIGVWIAVHGPLSRQPPRPPAHTNVRELVRQLFHELNLVPQGGVRQENVTEEVWEYLERAEARPDDGTL